MTSAEASTFLGNGVGMVYITGATGTFPTDAIEGVFPQLGIPNGRSGLNSARSWGLVARNQMFNTAASFRITITAAAADNLNVLNVNGIAQIAAPVAMTIGDPVASAASIAAAVNAYIAVPDWSAVAIDDTIYLKCNTVGSAQNNLPINVTFSGASTASYDSVTGGGSDANQRNCRIWIDISSTATQTVMAGSAVDITDTMAALPPTPVNTKVVVASAITLDRLDRETTWLVSGGNFNTINMVDAVEGDMVTLRGDTGTGVPATVIPTTGNIFIASGASFVLATDTDAISFSYINGKWEESNTHGSTREDLRSLGVAIPDDSALAGVETATMPVVGGYSIAPGATAGTDTGKFNVAFKGAAAALAANVTIILEHSLPGQVLQDGDEGFIYVEQVVTPGAFSVVITDTDAVVNVTIPTEILVAGKWGFKWIFNGSQFAGSFVPNVTATGWVSTSMIGALQVTDAEIAGMNGSKLTAASVDFTQLSAGVNAAISGNGIQVTPEILIPAASVGGAATAVGLTVPANMRAVVDTMLYKFNAYVAPAHGAGFIGVRCVGANQEQAQGIIEKSVTGCWQATKATEGAAAETQLLLGQDLEIYTTGIGGGGSDVYVVIYYRLIQI